MLKTGVYNLSQLKKGIEFKNWFGGEKKLSITLYDQIYNEPNADLLAERILLFFADERGAYKRTYFKRFEEFDATILDFLVKFYEKEFSLAIHDVAVSDGRTAADFFERISNVFSNAIYKASDYNPKVYILEKGKIKITVNNAYQVLEIVWPPFVLNTIKRESFVYYPINHLILLFLQNLIVKPLLKMYKVGEVKAREMLLFSPDVLKLSKIDSRFKVDQYDLLKPFKDKNHIIRAMNVLNTSYFTEKEFLLVLRNIHEGLFESGFLITGSNQESNSLVHGAIYKRMHNGFEKTWQSGDSSPIEDKILAFRN